jgi:hypothetical protein
MPMMIKGPTGCGKSRWQYYRFKDFTAHFDDDAKARLAGMRGGLSTRMGAA